LVGYKISSDISKSLVAWEVNAKIANKISITSTTDDRVCNQPLFCFN